MASAIKRSLNGFAAIAFAGSLFAASLAFSQTQVSISVYNAPPAARYEPVPASRTGYVWAPGYWTWTGHQYDWRRGHWERARPGYVYERPKWRQEREGWRLHGGAWHQQGHMNVRADRDCDGVPNRFDRDRDGGGVPNRHDNRSNNPYRY